jgi:nicotinamide-nucleotide amidase
MDETCQRLATRAGERIGDRTVASAESFTAGVVAQALASAESSSDWFAGAVVAYQVAVKRTVLGVAAQDVVTEQAAIEMAEGVARLLDADVGISTTGVAGPDDQDGTPAGTVVIGWTYEGESAAEVLHLDGDPEEVVVKGATAALERLNRLLEASTAAAEQVAD